ncbi:Hypothetical predicted protein [Olea europaea subsp. europaea]|uniref:Uncharacterized protein n=1 Tax=Olea europaea subsp. europaea TaxID=158383 RepID=A0A8S0VI31_OLEEU|nr:Hypothetical predicted protein [Olea europaea subsp. europaea]
MWKEKVKNTGASLVKQDTSSTNDAAGDGDPNMVMALAENKADLEDKEEGDGAANIDDSNGFEDMLMKS